MYYAVAKGVKPGIYPTWDECQKQTKGYSGAIFKKFPSESEAVEFLKSHNVQIEKSEPEKVKCQTRNFTEDYDLIAFVDGSFNIHTECYGSGVILIEGSSVQTFANIGTDPEQCSMRNVAGEIAGAKYAVEYALTHGKKRLLICYDYMGIENWANGSWKAKNKFTGEYSAFVREARKRITVNFRHVKGHSGDKYNEMADKLAKEAVGLT